MRHNIGPISAAKSRLLLLSQCRRLHRPSVGPTTAAIVNCLNLSTFSRNLAQYRPYTQPIVTFTMASSCKSRRARVRAMNGTLLGHVPLLPWQTILEGRKPEFGTERENSFFDLRSKKKFLWIKESFNNSKKISLIQRNRFVYIKEKIFKSTKLSSIQRNFFFDLISKKCFFDSKKLFSGCSISPLLCRKQLLAARVWVRIGRQMHTLVIISAVARYWQPIFGNILPMLGHY